MTNTKQMLKTWAASLVLVIALAVLAAGCNQGPPAEQAAASAASQSQAEPASDEHAGHDHAAGDHSGHDHSSEEQGHADTH